MQSSSRALAALRRSARRKCSWSSFQQDQRAIEAWFTSCGKLEVSDDIKPVIKFPKHFEEIKKESAHKLSAHTNMQERCIFSRRNAFRGKQPLNLMLLNTSMVARRQFASKSKGGGDDDEDVLDDVESRLMGEDYARDDMYMGDSSYAMGGVNFEDYGEWEKKESEAEGEEGEEGEGDSEGEGSGEGSDVDSDEDSANEQSDEEFEDERSDEELDELLANTPLFNPPELPENFRPDEPLPQFSFRPEGPVFYPGMEYEPEELDVMRPVPVRKREMRPKEEIRVEEVVDNADFRNVRYLTKFITETGCIIARREFKMRKKSHNRITKAIKTARFFGLMPYTNMGRPKFVFNEPFDEFSEFYETDEDEKRLGDMPSGTTNQNSYGSNYGNATPRYGGFGRDFGSSGPPRNGGYSGQGRGGFNDQNTWGRL